VSGVLLAVNAPVKIVTLAVAESENGVSNVMSVAFTALLDI
jgi:hypothetical protein